MKENFSYIAAFDMDKTILSVNSSKLVVTTSRRKGMMSFRAFMQAIYYSIVYKFDLKDANDIVVEMTRWLKGMKEEDVIALINEHVIPKVMGLIRPEITAVLDEHRKNQGKLVLLSSAMPYICEPIAKHLNMDDVVCSRLETKDGIFTGRPEGRLVFGKEKAVQLEKYCKVFNFSLESSWYYGDAFTDRFALKAAGNAVCVKPEIKLKRLAKRKGWQII